MLTISWCCFNLLQKNFVSPAEAVRQYASKLSPYELMEIVEYPEVYFVGHTAKKIRGTPNAANNHGYDEESGDYLLVEHDHVAYRYVYAVMFLRIFFLFLSFCCEYLSTFFLAIFSSSSACTSFCCCEYFFDLFSYHYFFFFFYFYFRRYEVLETLGKGSFGQVVKAFDHKTQSFVALKCIRNKKRFHQQVCLEYYLLLSVCLCFSSLFSIFSSCFFFLVFLRILYRRLLKWRFSSIFVGKINTTIIMWCIWLTISISVTIFASRLSC